jgi:hypothetical protein
LLYNQVLLVHTYQQNARFQTIFWLQYSLKFSLNIQLRFQQKFSNENEILLNNPAFDNKKTKTMYFASNITIYKLFQIIIFSIFFYARKKLKEIA